MFYIPRLSPSTTLACPVARAPLSSPFCLYEGQTPLLVAAYFNRVESVRLLLESGADNDVKDNVRRKGARLRCSCLFTPLPSSLQNGETALGLANEDGHAAVVALLQ